MRRLKRIWNKIRYGLILQYIKDRLAKIGIIICPFYWVQENIANNQPSPIQFDETGYKFDLFDTEDIKVLCQTPEFKSIYNEEKLLQRLKEGDQCFGAKYEGHIVAFTWICYKECNFFAYPRKLNKKEVYLYDLFTLKTSRGKNLAPYLRYKSYQFLNKDGYTHLYSISEWTNPPSIKFKKKLGANFLKLYLFIRLFNKYEKTWTIKEYKNN